MAIGKYAVITIPNGWSDAACIEVDSPEFERLKKEYPESIVSESSLTGAVYLHLRAETKSGDPVEWARSAIEQHRRES